MSGSVGSVVQTQSSWQRAAHRFAVGSYAVSQGLANLSTDLRLLLRRWKDGVVLRQKHLDGFQMIVRAEEEVGRAIYYAGTHESVETAFFRSRLDSASVCCDIGANVGYYSLLFASLSPKGVVHSFEPVPLNFYVLCTNRLLNSFSNLIANPCAVGDVDGSVEFVVSRDSAFSSLVDTKMKPMATEISVPIITLDSYCRKNGVNRIDVLKIDVEGAEGRVLAGAAQLLRNRAEHPRTVMLELYDPMLSRYDSGIDDILLKMDAYGYKPYVIHKDHLVPFRRDHHNILYNVLFLDD